MSQNLLNFVFLHCLLSSPLVKICLNLYGYFNSFIILCLLIISWSVVVACNFTVNRNWAGDILSNMTCSVNLCTFCLYELEKYFGNFCINFSTVEFQFVKWSTEVGCSRQTKYLLLMAPLYYWANKITLLIIILK